MNNKSKISIVFLLALFLLGSCTTTGKIPENTPSSGETAAAPEPQETISTAAAATAEPLQQKAPPVNPKVDFVQRLKSELANGSADSALTLFDGLSADLQNDQGLQILKASLFVSAGRLDEAAALGKQLEEQDPKNPDILALNVMIAKAAGNESEKDSIIKKMIAIDPYNSEANVELGEEQVLRHNYKLARKYYQLSLVKDPSNIRGLFGYGQTSYYLNALDDARTAFKNILASDSENALALCYLGKLEAEGQNYKKAVEYIEKALQSDPGNYDFYIDLGNYKRYLGKFSDAEAAFTKAIGIRPDYFLAYTYRGGLYDEQNKFDAAYNDYKKIVETNPGYYFAYELLGILAWHAEDYAQAVKAFGLAWSVNKKNVSYPLMQAASYYKTGNNLEAEKVLEDAMKTLDRSSLDYEMVRLYHDRGGVNAESSVTLKVQNETDNTKRGKMLYYLGLYWELKGLDSLAEKYYAEVASLNCPLFFEYRLAEWCVK
ncbi:MAG: tetratricopeptide repeat protein [Treponema sp.]|jgi:tetratricopeptide (TPR) repeat protein|nr:tetratricopeptide repeat protein [Treponema sp.]